MKGFSFLLMAAVALSLGLLLTACNTVRGFGQDVKAGGQALTRSADTQQRAIERDED